MARVRSRSAALLLLLLAACCSLSAAFGFGGGDSGGSLSVPNTAAVKSDVKYIKCGSPSNTSHASCKLHLVKQTMPLTPSSSHPLGRVGSCEPTPHPLQV